MHTVTLLIPFIAICLMGYGAIRFGLLTQTHSDALAKICFNILIPLFLFRSTYLTDLDTNISFTWFLSFYLPVIACFIFVYGVCRYTLKRGTASATIKALVGNYSNTVLIAIPILASVLPLEVAGQGFVIIGLHSAILFTLTELLMRGISPKAILGGLNNPIVVSIFAGLFCNLIDLPIPELLLEPMALLSESAIALALFGLGASLNFLPVKGNRTTALLLSLNKLLLLPSLVYLLGLFVLALNPQQLLISVVLTAAPTGAASFLIASQHNQDQDIAATTVVLSTVLCPLTYLLWLELLV